MTLIQKIAIWIVPVIFAITVHEVAHGWVASIFGDKTAKQLGRLTLNPVKHIDFIGTLVVPLFLLAFGGILFGWAKPVPVNQQNLRSPRWHMAIVALAGPFANLLMALVWMAILKIITVVTPYGGQIATPLSYICQAGILVNLILMILNLIPIPPLDGSRILSAFLPRRWVHYYERLEAVGFIILVLLLVGGVLGHIIGPIFRVVIITLLQLFGIS